MNKGNRRRRFRNHRVGVRLCQSCFTPFLVGVGVLQKHHPRFRALWGVGQKNPHTIPLCAACHLRLHQRCGREFRKILSDRQDLLSKEGRNKILRMYWGRAVSIQRELLPALPTEYYWSVPKKAPPVVR